MSKQAPSSIPTVTTPEPFPKRYFSTEIPSTHSKSVEHFDVAFYPEERGPYNFDTEGEPGVSLQG